MDENTITTEETTMEPEETTEKKSSRHLTPAEQLARIAEQQKQLAARARQIRARESQKERKARAHRLIQVGVVVESVFGGAITEEMLPALEAFLKEQDKRGKYFTNALTKKAEQANG